MASSHAEPPDVLDTDLELTPTDWPHRQTYLLLNSLVVPRPIAWISTVSASGIRNIAPHSYFNVATSNPPHIMFSSERVKDTLANIRETGDFVVNIVSMDNAEVMNATSTDFPFEEDEFTWAGLDAAPSVAVKAPRIASAKAHLECRLVQEVPVGNQATVVIGEVVHLHVVPSVWRSGEADPGLLDPVCRLTGHRYAHLGEAFQILRPRWELVREAPDGDRFPHREP